MFTTPSDFRTVSGLGASRPRLIAPTLAGVLGDLGSDERKAQLARAKFRAMVDAQRNTVLGIHTSVIPKNPVMVKIDPNTGQVKVPVGSFMSDFNREASRLMAPFSGVIAALPIPRDVRHDLRHAPIDALMNIFDPIEDAVGRAVDRTLAKKGNHQNYFGTVVNVKRVQTVDLKTDASSQNFMRRFRTMRAFFILVITQPIEFAAQLLQEGINIVGEGATAIGKVASDFATAAGKITADIVKATADAAGSVAAWFGLGGLGAYGGLGVEPTSIASSILAAIGVTLDPAIVAILDSIITMIVGLISAAVGSFISGGGKADSVALSPAAIASGKAQAQSGGAPGGGAPGGGGDSGGIPMVAVLGVAAAIGVFLLWK